MSTENLIEKAMQMTPVEVDAHYERINREQSRWVRLEYARRVALNSTSVLLDVFAKIELHELKELFAHVLQIGAKYVQELDHQKESRKRSNPAELMKISLDALWWVDTLHLLYPATTKYDPTVQPATWQEVMIQLLTNAADFLNHGRIEMCASFGGNRRA